MRGHTWSVASLALVALMAGACGDSGSTAPSAREAPGATPPAVPAVEMPKVTPTEPAALPPAPGEAAATKPAAVKPAMPAKPDVSDTDAAVGAVETVAKELGVEISDENRKALEKVAEAVQDGDTQEAIKGAAEKLGVDAGALEGAGLGGLGTKLGLEGDDEKAAAAAKKKAADATDEGKKAVDTELSGMNANKLRMRRKAEVAALVADREKALADLRTKFAEKIADKPAKAGTLAQRQAEKEAEISADFSTQITAVKKRYQAAIDAVKQ